MAELKKGWKPKKHILPPGYGSAPPRRQFGQKMTTKGFDNVKKAINGGQRIT